MVEQQDRQHPHGAEDLRQPGAARGRPRHRPHATVTVEEWAGRPMVRVTGQIDWDTVTEVAPAIRELAADGARELTVHLGDCRNGPNLLAMLGRIRLALTECGGRQELVGVALPEFPPALAAAPIEQVSLFYDAVRHDAQPGKTRRAPRGPSEAIAE